MVFAIAHVDPDVDVDEGGGAAILWKMLVLFLFAANGSCHFVDAKDFGYACFGSCCLPWRFLFL